MKVKKPSAVDFDVFNLIVDRAFYMALKMIDIANSREVKERGEPKVGGHPSACASSQHILSAIHLFHRKPEDYIACKPHVERGQQENAHHQHSHEAADDYDGERALRIGANIVRGSRRDQWRTWWLRYTPVRSCCCLLSDG